MAGRAKKRGKSSIVIRREEASQGGGHHGGAWKVAYADFVTAMMAFFLLMWLINATTEKQRRGLADYFSPDGPTTRAMSGSGKPFGGLTPYETGALVSNRGLVSVIDSTGKPAATAPVPTDPDDPTGRVKDKSAKSTDPGAKTPAATDPDAIPVDGDSHQDGASGRADATEDRAGNDAGHASAAAQDPPSAAAAELASDTPPDAAASPIATAVVARPVPMQAAQSAEQKRFGLAASDLRRTVSSDASLGDAAGQLAVDLSPTELRIQIIDAEHKPMFGPNSAEPDPRARRLLADVAPVLAKLGEPVTITGHTDSAPCAGRCPSGWSLSAARADAARALLEAAGLPDARLAGVTGVSDHEPLLTGQPDAPENRRIVMVVTRRRPAPPAAPATPPPASAPSGVPGPTP